MTFTLDHVRETAAEEQARLAEAPLGSRNHGLSQLPVLINDWPEGKVVKLPKLRYADGSLPEYSIVVVPHRYNPTSTTTADGRTLRHGGSFTSIVVASDYPTYVAGTQLDIPAAEIARGTQIEI